jgi:YVTN family beta-propeller protein
MEITKDGQDLWVTSRWINKVTVVDLETKRIKQQVAVGRSPHGISIYGHAPRQ